MNRPYRTLIFLAVLFAHGARAEGLRDPMRPAGSAPPAAPRMLALQSLRLEGVIDGQKRFAIINGRLVSAGDEVAGVRILEVLSQGVRFERAGKVTTLMLPARSANVAVQVARSKE
jgi:hypothetical protein